MAGGRSPVSRFDSVVLTRFDVYYTPVNRKDRIMYLVVLGASVFCAGLGFVAGVEWQRRKPTPVVHVPPERMPVIHTQPVVDDYQGSLASIVYATPSVVRQAATVALKAVKRLVWDGPSAYVRRHRSRWSRPFKRWTRGAWPTDEWKGNGVGDITGENHIVQVQPKWAPTRTDGGPSYLARHRLEAA